MKSTGQIFIFSILKTFTKKLFLTFCPLLFTFPLLGQVSDDFSDNELTQNPLWLGNPDHFSAESGALKLRAPASESVSYLSTANTLSKGAVWECRVILSFNPSNANFSRIYLVSDNSNLTDGLEGFYVQVGGAADDVCLYRQRGMERNKLIDGEDGVVGNDVNDITIRVTRTSSGDWELLTRTAVNEAFRSQGVAANEQSDVIASYAGIECVYTSTRADKFSFDNFIVTTLDDRVPPNIRQARVNSANEVELVFSEPLTRASAENVLNYESEIGHPTSVKHDAANPSAALLFFALNFDPWKEYHLTVLNVADPAGNVLTRDTISFTFKPGTMQAFRDVVITEIFPDPSPTAGLPEVEFIEILNTTSNPVDLSRWTISDASSAGMLPEGEIINPGEYVILTISSQASNFAGLGRVVGVPSFPSFNNESDDVILKDSNGQTIDSIRFEQSWHDDSGKSDGGWSLEIIDPLNPCGGKTNWGSSDHSTGGTPGGVNSIDDVKPDLTGPRLVFAKAILPDTVLLIFDETLHHIVPEPAGFAFSPLKEVVAVSHNKTRNAIIIKVNPGIVPDEALSIAVDGIRDCSGNVVQAGSQMAPVVLPAPADSLDVVVNEILFNPRTGGVDFIEVFNRSKKYVDMTGWALGTLGAGGVENKEHLKAESLILPPAQYVAFSTDPQIILSDYPLAPIGKVLPSPTPPMNDDAGSIVLLDGDGNIIDAVYYADNLHSIFLKETEGISLERISPDESSMNAGNWKSAASQSGYATPGYRNSNARNESGHGDGVILQPEIFSPQSSDRNFTLIEYSFDNGGYIGTVSILDQRGRCIKKVAENALLGASGFFRWDGDRDDGVKASMGNYMVRFELFNSQGVVKVVRKRVAVASQF